LRLDKSKRDLIGDALLSLHAKLLLQIPDLELELRSTSGKLRLGFLFGGKLRLLGPI
jgi:hypothetical protein